MSGVSWTERQLAERNGGQPKHKYNARRKTVDGITFASCREAERYIELKACEQAGLISGLTLQPEYVLQAAQNGMRAIKYRADFKYSSSEGTLCIEDVKGFRTPVYQLKAKLFRAKFPDIDLREVR
jgi:hypothetical protein